MKVARIDIKWDMVELCVGRIHKQVMSAGTAYDYIVGLSRGGVIPATMLAYRLSGIKLRVDQPPILSPAGDGIEDPPSVLSIDRGAKVLIVDDIVDTGESLKWYYSAFKHKYCPGVLSTASLLVKVAAGVTTTYTGIRINSANSDAYYSFPWERYKPPK